MRGHCLRVGLLLIFAVPAWATTIIRGSFPEIVAEAEIVFEGVVTDVRSKELPDRVIVTDVTFQVLRSLKGSPSEVVVLTFVGGTVGNQTLEISDMPRFARGDRDIVFAAPGRNGVSPLVRFMQGRFRIIRDERTGLDVVRQFDGTTVGSTAHVAGVPQGAASREAGVPMAPSEFASAVSAEVVRQIVTRGR